LPAFSVRFLQGLVLAVFAVACYLVGLRSWRFAVIFVSAAAAIMFFAFFYERMIQGLVRR
jgi:hypothetical protein